MRRRHNYIPLILELLKIASEKGELQELYDQAKIKQAEARDAAKKKKEEIKA